ncbi:hypothetical protein SGI37_20515, partial [Providencia rettgeri]
LKSGYKQTLFEPLATTNNELNKYIFINSKSMNFTMRKLLTNFELNFFFNYYILGENIITCAKIFEKICAVIFLWTFQERC